MQFALSPERARVFLSRIHVASDDECWPWLAGKTPDGYGEFCIGNKRNIGAHRIALDWEMGGLPVGALTCHRCDNPSCCNPAHLFAGTHADNQRDCVAKGRRPKHIRRDPAKVRKGESVPAAKLSEADVREIRSLHASGVRLIKIRPSFPEVTYTTLSDIVRRRSWRHLP